jgi:hypothetical protein
VDGNRLITFVFDHNTRALVMTTSARVGKVFPSIERTHVGLIHPMLLPQFDNANSTRELVSRPPWGFAYGRQRTDTVSL